MLDVINKIGEKFVSIFINLVPKIPGLVLTFLAGYLIIKILIFFSVRVMKLFRFGKALRDLLCSLLSVVLWILLVAQLASQLGLPNLAITISGSVVAFGFAIANGAATFASDVIAGFSLAKDRDFACGYRVKIGDLEGIIEKIDIRKVRIKSDDGKIHIIPNSKIDNALGWTILERG